MAKRFINFVANCYRRTGVVAGLIMRMENLLPTSAIEHSNKGASELCYERKTQQNKIK